jgi:hypothetical protein
MMRLAGAFIVLNAALTLGAAVPASTADAPVPELRIARAQGAIQVDGLLDDAGWKTAVRVEQWFETNPGDNTPPPVGNVGYLAYDERFLYAAFEFQDPEPGKIRAPFSDRDNVGSDTDYGGIILDTRNDNRGLLLLANARGIQYDSISSDASGNEDASPDFFWESAARIHEKGWVLELRVPFSSLRYSKEAVQSWGVMLYRNYPRQFRYQFFSTRLPRGGTCFICHSNRMVGLERLPTGGHVVVAPYATAARSGSTDDPGSPLDTDPFDGHLGLDVKWTPSADLALDATVNPDFSQIESDVAQIGANERFALFFPEKRPFFLEGIELLSTPIQAVYTRTITSPRFGLRGTGKMGKASYTGLVVQDRGGGSVVLPGPESSDLADQDFRSWVALGRVRRDIGRSFVSVLVSDREVRGGGFNRLAGPDFQWRPGDSDTVTGQILFSRTRTPDRPELSDTWNGERLSGHAADIWYSHNSRTLDWFAEYRDFAHGFRADNGFVPQVGFRQTFGEAGYTFRPEKGFLRRLRTFTFFDRQAERGGGLISRDASVGAGMDGRFNSFMRFWYVDGRVRAGEVVLPRRLLRFVVQLSPTSWLSGIGLEGFAGREVDFDNARTGTGADVRLRATLRPSSHLELAFNSGRRFLDVSPPGMARSRLFTAHVDRLRATYTFNARSFVRAIGQRVETKRDPSLFVDEVERRESSFEGSVLFAYKINWQTLVFLGYGDTRALSDEDRLEPSDRQLFLKISYAFQR